MIAVVGCGNANRRDDGAGPEVIRILRSRDLEARTAGLRLIDAGTDGMAAMFAARGCRFLILVDACRSGSEPGAVFELPGSEVEQRHAPALNLHDFRWDHALYAGRRMFKEDFPDDVVVLLVEAQDVDFGLELSPPASAAARIVADRVEALVRSRALPPQASSVTLRCGSLYLSAALCDRYFAGLESVILLRRDDELLILPVRHAAAGGYLLKRRNQAGDRVVNAPDFFREQGVCEERELCTEVSWSSERGALVARMPTQLAKIVSTSQ
jgi:hydrogenase maturation protease